MTSSAARSTAGFAVAPSFGVSAALLCGLCGLLMSTLPYVCWYTVAHSSLWIADVDELVYTLTASHAYYWHPFYLSDPTFVHGGQSVYSWLQLIPAELVCKALGLSPIRFGLILRIFGGLAVGLGWYAVIWQHVRRPWVATLGAAFVLTDSGWLVTRPFVRQWTILTSIVFHRAGEIFAHDPSIHHNWRIISPVVVLPFLLFYLWALRRSVDHFSPAKIICSGFAFGLLFFVYFYYWTAAGLALALGLVVDRARWRTYFHTGWIGVLLGTPELARMLLTRNRQGSEWMQRFDEFVPIPRLSEHGRFLLSALLVVITFVIVMRFYRQLLYLWSLCASGFLMIHQQLFSGLQMQNYHWAYLFCPCMTLLLALLTIDALSRAEAHGRLVRGVVVVAVLSNAALGLYLRGVEAVRTKDSQHYSRGYQDYAEQHSARGYQPLAAGAVTAGAEDFVEYAMIVDHVSPLASAYPVVLSPSVTDSDLDHRLALNSYLYGTSRAAFEAEQRWELSHLQYGVELRNLARRRERLASRLMWFDQVASDPAKAIDNFQVRYFALPANTPRPVTLGSEWSLLQNGPAWEVWERHHAAAPAWMQVTGTSLKLIGIARSDVRLRTPDLLVASLRPGCLPVDC